MSDTVTDLLEALTLSEKCSLLHGTVDPDGRATGYISGVERLDVPPFRMVDGPLGVRIPGESSTAFPAPLSLAASFDADLAHELGTALGRETRGKDQDVLLAPGMNVLRVPHNGRNFEYFSEDPVHSSVFAREVVSGVESTDVVATPKHYLANNQETDRATVDVQVSERALREIYLPSFEAAVEAGAGSVMTAYNTVNGTRMSDHEYLVNDVLKDEFGFEGFTVSDWFGTEETAAAANGGLDVEMPGISMGEMVSSMREEEVGASEAPTDIDFSEGFPEEIAGGMADPATCERFAETLEDAVEAGAVSEQRLDDMVARVLGQMERVGLFDGDRDEGAVDTEEHRELAQRVATRGTVLLDNDGILPLAEETDVALIGPNVDEPVLGGGGSSETSPLVQTSPVEGLTERAGGDVEVVHGLPRIEGLSPFDFLGVRDEEHEPAGEVDLEGAAETAAAADVAVVFVRDVATEAIDRESLALPERQDELVETVAEANDRTVVVCNTSGPVELPWRDEVAAIVQNWYPGQAHGDSIASVLYGDADPGGRLPVTFAPEGAYPTDGDERRFPGVDGKVHYEEGVFVGYRHFDDADAEPTYPFGHGRSYADFEYGEATADGGTVSVTVENVADRDGVEVVQAYVRPPAIEAVDRPTRELAGFEAVEVAAGEQATVEIDLDELAFSRYDETEGWTVDPGEYTVEIGGSSRDVRAELTVER